MPLDYLIQFGFMATEIVPRESEDGEDIGLSDRQVAALEAMHAMGASPRVDGEPYSPDRRIRAQQLIYEGRLGGPGRGQGRPRQPRASEAVAKYVKETLTPKIQKALRDGLAEDEDITIRLKTADMALKIEREEAGLQLKEEQSDLDNLDKEQLIAALIQLAEDPSTEAAIDATADIELPPEAVTDISEPEEVINGYSGAAEASRSEGARTPARVAQAGPDTGEVRSNGSQDATGRSGKPENPFVAAKRRRTKQRRRAS